MNGHHGPSLTPFLLKKGGAFTHMASCSSLLGHGSNGSFAAWASKVLGLPTVGLQKRLALRIWLVQALLQTRLFQSLQGVPEITNSSPRDQRLLRTVSNPQARVLEKPDGPLRHQVQSSHLTRLLTHSHHGSPSSPETATVPSTSSRRVSGASSVFFSCGTSLVILCPLRFPNDPLRPEVAAPEDKP